MQLLVLLSIPLLSHALSMSVGGGGKHLSAEMRAQLKNVAAQVRYHRHTPILEVIQVLTGSSPSLRFSVRLRWQVPGRDFQRAMKVQLL